jgi:hypothetical protein
VFFLGRDEAKLAHIKLLMITAVVTLEILENKRGKENIFYEYTKREVTECLY